MSGTWFLWFHNLITGFAQATSWLTSNVLTIGDLEVSPLGLISFAGLTAFIVVALVKWVVN